jgi:hypothetical protein
VITDGLADGRTGGQVDGWTDGERIGQKETLASRRSGRARAGSRFFAAADSCLVQLGFQFQVAIAVPVAGETAHIRMSQSILVSELRPYPHYLPRFSLPLGSYLGLVLRALSSSSFSVAGIDKQYVWDCVWWWSSLSSRGCNSP